MAFLVTHNSRLHKLTTATILIFALEACSPPPKPTGSSNSSSASAGNNCDKQASFTLAATADDASYQGGVKGILNSKCAYSGCHDGAAEQPDLTNYQSAKAAGDRIIARAITSANMPEAGSFLPIIAAEKEVLQLWSDNGFPDARPSGAQDKTEGNSSGDGTTVGFGQVAAVMDEHCLGCHSAESANGGVVLDEKSKFNEHATKSELYTTNGHKGTNVSSEQQQIVSDYVASLTSDGKAGGGSNTTNTNGATGNGTTGNSADATNAECTTN